MESPSLPPDVRAVLAQLLDAAVDRVEGGDHAGVEGLLDTVETVVRNKVPTPEERERLLGGCETVRTALGTDDGTAAAYLRAMRRRVGDA